MDKLLISGGSTLNGEIEFRFQEFSSAYFGGNLIM